MTKAKPRAKPAAPKTERLDGWNNVLTGLGTLARDKRLSSVFNRGCVLTMQELDAMYHEDDIVALIADIVPQEMTREWIEVQDDTGDELTTALASIDAQCVLTEGLTWARLYGGAGVLLGVDDGQDPSMPLDVNRIKAFEWMLALDRWDISIYELYTDTLDVRYGTPKTYQIQASNARTGQLGAVVHESRVLRLEGVLTSRRRRLQLGGWGESAITRVYEVVRDFQAAFASASVVMQNISQAVIKIEGLAAMLASDQDGLILDRLRLLDMTRATMRAIVLDSKEDFENKPNPVTGLDSLLDRAANRLSAATGIPVTLLMGQAPAGLNATGDSDTRNWSNKIKRQQESQLRPPLTRVMTLLAAARGISLPATGPEFTFRPLYQPSEAEKADARLKVAQADQIYLSTGVLDPSEVAVSRFGGARYSIETQIDAGARNAQPVYESPGTATDAPAPTPDPSASGPGISE